METLQQDLFAELARLPPQSNPYEFIDQFLVEKISPRRPKSFELQLVICMVAHGMCGLLVVASLVVRVYRGSFWLVHFKAKNLKLWTPHFTAGWSLWAVVLIVLLELAVWNAKALGTSLQPKFAYWWTFAWVPAWMGGFSAAWAITVSLLLHLYNNSARDDRLVERIAPFVNALAISLPAMYLAAIVPMAYHCSRLYESPIEHVETIRDFLQTSAATFDGNFSLLDLAPMLGTAENLKRAYHGFEKWLRITFAYYAGSALLLVLLLAVVATLYVGILRKALNEIGDSAALREDGMIHRKIMEKTYSNLVVTLVCFTTMGSIFSGLSFYIAIDPGALSSHATAEAICLLAFYSFALFGLPTSFLLFVRSFDRTRLTPPSTGTSHAPRFPRGRAHSHLPSLSLPFSRNLSSSDSSTAGRSPLSEKISDKVGVGGGFDDELDQLDRETARIRTDYPPALLALRIRLANAQPDDDKHEAHDPGRDSLGSSIKAKNPSF
ncbi:hypothetical protein JCM3766R1_001531 [Sporobolomyces carnicolor]